MVAEEAVDGPFAVINADDFYGRGSYEQLAAFLASSPRPSSPRGEGGAAAVPQYALVAFVLRHTLSEHGHVARGVCVCDENGRLVEVVERTRIERHGNGAVFTSADGSLTELTGDEPVSVNFWGFDRSIFTHLREAFSAFLAQDADSPKAEFFLPAVVDTLIRRGEATCRVLHTREQWAGVTYQADRPAIRSFVAEQVAAGKYPSPLW
jgi:hypothetical protein